MKLVDFGGKSDFGKFGVLFFMMKRKEEEDEEEEDTLRSSTPWVEFYSFLDPDYLQLFICTKRSAFRVPSLTYRTHLVDYY